MIHEFTGGWEAFSNFHILVNPIEHDYLVYRTSEALYQALKTESWEWRKKIADARTPGLAKRLGRRAPLRPNWKLISIDTMRFTLQKKFFGDDSLRSLLIVSRPRQIVEGNGHHDNVWGDCSCFDCHDIPGQNQLGILLMELRDRFLVLK